MSQVRANSSPDFTRPSTSSTTTIAGQQYDDSALEGVAAHIKLLLKLTQDHKDACDKEKNGSRRVLRVATMMTILDNVRDRIQKCQSFGYKGSASGAELRRCNTVPRPNPFPGVNGDDVADDEKERLRRELSASLAAQKNLQVMCTSLGKEKEIMAAELSRKAQQLSGTEELINDLKAQNETLLQKVKECATEHKDKQHGGDSCGVAELHVTSALQERNRMLSEQLLRSLDGYRSMKRKLRVAQEENGGMRAAMDEMRAKVVGSLERIRSFNKERVVLPDNSRVDVVEEEIAALESMFECFRAVQVTKHEKKQGDCGELKGEMNACKPSVVV